MTGSNDTPNITPIPSADDQFLTPPDVIVEEAQAYGGLDKIKFRQTWIRCKACNLQFPAQIAIGLDTTKLKCPVCGGQHSEEIP